MRRDIYWHFRFLAAYIYLYMPSYIRYALTGGRFC